jgi:hypothetical protein
MKLLRHTPIQIRVASAKNNSDGPRKLFKLESDLRAGSYGWQQILVQAKEARHQALFPDLAEVPGPEALTQSE